MQIITNNRPRNLIYGHDLSAKERAQFDYLDNIESGSFFRYRGATYDLGGFMRVPADSELSRFDGYASDTYFSGLAIKLVEEGEAVIVARYCA